MSEHETERGSPLIGTCNLCGQTLATKVDLSKHVTDAHESEEPTAGSSVMTLHRARRTR